MTRLRPVLCAAVALTVATACELPDPQPTPASISPAPVETTSTTAVATDDLARVRVDDHPNPQRVPYDRMQWMPNGWVDGNGCDTRADILTRDSLIPVTRTGCKVTAGRWPLVYVTGETTVPGKLDIDHIVPLGLAHQSGGWAWSAGQRVTYSHDPDVLWAVDASQNRRKSDDGPDGYLPPNQGVWCEYAHRFVAILVKYDLTATTEDRDALGQMGETCEAFHSVHG